MSDQVFVTNRVPYSPSSSIECFTYRADRDGTGGNWRAKCCHSRERSAIVEVFVDFVTEDDYLMCHAQIPYRAELLCRKYFPQRIVTGKN